MLAENREFFHKQPAFKNQIEGDFVRIWQRFFVETKPEQWSYVAICYPLLASN